MQMMKRNPSWRSTACLRRHANDDEEVAVSGLAPARYRSRLLHPRRHLCLVEIVLVDVAPARVLARASGWNGPQRRASEERHLHVPGEDVEPQEPALAL